MSWKHADLWNFLISRIDDKFDKLSFSMTRQDTHSVNATTSAKLAWGGSSNDRKQLIQRRITRALLAIGFVLVCMLGAGLMLRFAVSKLNDPKSLIVQAELRRASRTNQQVRDDQTSQADQLRANARSFDERLLRDRRDREWVYQSKKLPDYDDAKLIWQMEVNQIERQIEEARQLQAEVEANEPDREFDLFGEGSVLQDRIERLKQMREDAPSDSERSSDYPFAD